MQYCSIKQIIIQVFFNEYIVKFLVFVSFTMFSQRKKIILTMFNKRYHLSV